MAACRKPVALFTAGGPGVGKSTALALLLPGLPFVSLDSDAIQDELMAQFPGKPRAALRPLAFDLLEARQNALVEEARDLVVNTTGADLAFATALRDRLSNAGYRTAMIFVRAPLAAALGRNRARLHPVPEDDLRAKHRLALANRPRLGMMFAPDFWEISGDAGPAALRESLAPVRTRLEALTGALRPARRRRPVRAGIRRPGSAATR